MTELNQRFRNVAEDLIGRLGMDAELVERVVVTDKAEGKVYTQSETRDAVRVSPPEPYYKYVDGERIATEELSCMLAAQGVTEPKLRQALVVAGKEHKILGVQPLYGGDLAVLYVLRVSS